MFYIASTEHWEINTSKFNINNTMLQDHKRNKGEICIKKTFVDLQLQK